LLTEELNELENLENLTVDQLWNTYKEVIPHIEFSGIPMDNLSND
jgi:hypothetical protein